MRVTRVRLKQLATGGTASVVFNAGAINVIRLGSNLTLTRLLTPEAFGVTAIIVSIQLVIALLSDVGFYDFIVQHKDGDDPKFRDQVWSIRLVRGAVLTLLMLAFAYPMAWFLQKPILGPVIAVWSFAFLLDGLSSLAWATSVRNQQFWRLSSSDLLSNVVGSIVSIIVAATTHSYWSLVAGMGGTAIASTLLSYTMFPDMQRRWDFCRARSRELWIFSRFITFSSVLTLIVMQADKLLFARLMPLYIFGLYGVASTLAAAPNQLSLTYTSRVLLSAYADAARQGIEELRQAFYRRRRKVALLYMFLVGAGIGGAPLGVAILYRPSYYSITPYLQLLLISTGLRLSSTSAKWALIAMGRTAASFYSQVWAAAWLAVGAVVSIATHNLFLLIVVVGTAEVPSLLCNWWNLRKEGILDMRAEGLELGAALVGGGIGWVVSDAALTIWPHL